MRRAYYYVVVALSIILFLVRLGNACSRSQQQNQGVSILATVETEARLRCLRAAGFFDSTFLTCTYPGAVGLPPLPQGCTVQRVPIAGARAPATPMTTPAPLAAGTPGMGSPFVSLPIAGNAPSSLAVDGKGNVYANDYVFDGMLFKYAPDGRRIDGWRMHVPNHMAVDADGSVYVTDSDAKCVLKLSPAGEIDATWSGARPSPGQFSRPSGIALDAHGNVYVADSDNNQIQKLSPTGEPLAKWGAAGTEPGQLKSPIDIAVAPDSSIYVLDYGNNRVQKLAPDGSVVADWAPAPKPASPFGLSVDAVGNLYVIERSGLVTRYSPGGQQTGQWTVQPGPIAGIAVQGTGTVYVGDRGDGRLKQAVLGGR